MNFFSTKTSKRICLALAACMPLLAPLDALAHRQFIVPTSTVVNGKAPWVSFDAAAATDVFFFDHVAMNLTNLVVTAADGSIIKVENQSTGKLRSSFDFRAEMTGTYRVAVVNDGVNASYKENGATKRWRGTVEAFAKEVPANAEELQVSHNQGRVETFVTNGKPSTIAATGKGLELSPITHPNDLVVGEAAQFKFLIDGKPAVGAKVTVIAGGIRYRQKLDEQILTTDSEGKVSINWQGAGLYWLQASLNDNKSTVPGIKDRRASYVATLEVMPQ
ncbi:DUF4198 domain-containing protein [Undibacterium danionis]|uniref:DUF4198 domain-containing protein n=1 Tax=Undibacterium danionis TaxID=1812100 RepID=A0ABV6IET8_9BURK